MTGSNRAAVALLVAALLGSLPHGAAQGSGVLADALLIEGPASPPPLTPDLGFEELVFAHQVVCDWDRPRLAAFGAVKVAHELDTEDDDIILTGPLRRGVDVSACADPTTQHVPFDAVFHVAATRDAAGQTPTAITVRSTVEAMGATSEPATAKAMVEVAYLGWVRLDTDQGLKDAVDGEATFDLIVTNVGNSRSALLFDAEAEPGVDVDLPEGVVLESAAQGGTETTKTMPVTVRMSGGEAMVKITVTPVSTKEPTEVGAGRAINLLVRDYSFLDRVESPPPALPLLLIGLAIAAWRRS